MAKTHQQNQQQHDIFLHLLYQPIIIPITILAACDLYISFDSM
jgi:hypothetical protein